MKEIILFFMIVFMLVADAIIFFAIGLLVKSKKIILSLKKDGWKIEPPSVDKNL